MRLSSKSLSEYCQTVRDVKTLFTQKEHIENIKANVGLYLNDNGTMVLQIFPTDNIKTNGQTVKAFLELARVKGLKVISTTTNPCTIIEQRFKGEIFP